MFYKASPGDFLLETYLEMHQLGICQNGTKKGFNNTDTKINSTINSKIN